MLKRLESAIKLVNEGEMSALCKKKWPVPFFISDEEIAFLRLCCGVFLPEGARIAEIGATVGSTSLLFADSTKSKSAGDIEVYSKFDHTRGTRTYLGGLPSWPNAQLFDYWSHVVERHKSRMVVFRGDLRSANRRNNADLDLVYVDAIREPSEFAALNNTLLTRLKPGGILLLRDYFYWDNPWAVVQSESLKDSFHSVGDIGFSMGVYIKKDDLQPNWLEIDCYDSLSRTQAGGLIHEASRRYSGARKGLLRLSRVRLMHGDDSFDTNKEMASIIGEFGKSPRVKRYIEAYSKWSDTAETGV